MFHMKCVRIFVYRTFQDLVMLTTRVVSQHFGPFNRYSFYLVFGTSRVYINEQRL
jgi:hypothetical protein